MDNNLHAEVLATARLAFSTGKTKSLSWRRKQLQSLMVIVEKFGDFLAEALNKDLRKPKQEAYGLEVSTFNLTDRLHIINASI